MDDIFERKLETRKQILVELKKQILQVEEDIAFERCLKCWDRLERLQGSHSQLVKCVARLQNAVIG